MFLFGQLWKLHKEAASYFEKKLLEASTFNTTVVRSHTSHLIDYPKKMSINMQVKG